MNIPIIGKTKKTIFKTEMLDKWNKTPFIQVNQKSQRLKYFLYAENLISQILFVLTATEDTASTLLASWFS